MRRHGANPAPEAAPTLKRKAESDPAEQDAKRSKVVDGKVKLTIQCANDGALQGQVFAADLEVASTVKSVKETLADMIGGVKANKIQLKFGSAFLKDLVTLEKAGVFEGVLEVVSKKRGGKK